MNALAVFVFAMPALLAARRNLRLGLILALALVAAHAGYGYIRLNAPPAPPPASLPSASCSRRSTCRRNGTTACATASSRPRWNFLRVRTEAGKPAPQLILWPETAVPFFFTERPDALAAIGEMLKPGQMLVTGAVREEASGGAVTALLQFRHRDRRQRRDRRRGRQGPSGAVRRVHSLRRRGGAVSASGNWSPGR